MKTLIFDIEANGFNPDKIFCIVAYEVETKQLHSFDPSQIKEGAALLSSADKLVGHNILGYDIPVIKSLCGVDLDDGRHIVDTLVMSRLFNPTREGGHSLENWGAKLGYNKIKYDNFEYFKPEMLEYCERDVMVNYKVYRALQIESQDFSKKCIDLEHDVYRIIIQQRANGFKLDVKTAMLLVAELNEKLEEAEQEVHKTFLPKVTVFKLQPKLTKSGSVSKMAGVIGDNKNVRLSEEEYQQACSAPSVAIERVISEPFNLGSRKQIGEYLVEFGWKPKRFTATGQPMVDESTLEGIKDIPEAQVIAKYLMLQKRIAQINSWLDAVGEDERVHGNVNSNGAVTGRMTHSSPNMAQVPSTNSPYGKECRSCWTVDTNKKLVGIDASGLELRMLAHYMNDKEYTYEILNGDIHTANQKLAGLESRNQAKTFIYALLYGAGDEKLGSVVGGNKKDGDRLRKRFFANLPAFKSLKDSVSRASAKGYVKGLDGRKLFIRSEHSALNTLLQGAGAIVMKEALIVLNKLLKEKNYNAKFVANVHDEWQIETDADIADEVGQLGVAAIGIAGRNLKLQCQLDGEYNIGNNWYETH